MENRHSVWRDSGSWAMRIQHCFIGTRPTLHEKTVDDSVFSQTALTRSPKCVLKMPLLS